MGRQRGRLAGLGKGGKGSGGGRGVAGGGGVGERGEGNEVWAGIGIRLKLLQNYRGARTAHGQATGRLAGLEGQGGQGEQGGARQNF